MNIIIITLLMLISSLFNEETETIQQTLYFKDDIYYVNYDNRSISTEMGKYWEFSSTEELVSFIENKSVYDSNIIGYQQDIDYLAEQGYIYVTAINNSHIELNYHGPRYGENAELDTMYTITRFFYKEELIKDSIIITDWYNID